MWPPHAWHLHTAASEAAATATGKAAEIHAATNALRYPWHASCSRAAAASCHSTEPCPDADGRNLLRASTGAGCCGPTTCARGRLGIPPPAAAARCCGSSPHTSPQPSGAAVETSSSHLAVSSAERTAGSTAPNGTGGSSGRGASDQHRVVSGSTLLGHAACCKVPETV